MGGPRLQVGFTYEGFGFSGEIPLGPLADLFAGLQERNAQARAAEGVSQVATLRIRTVCPRCCAGVVHLTALCVDGVRMRACRRCHHQFDVE